MINSFEHDIQVECLVAFAHSRIIGLFATSCGIKESKDSVFNSNEVFSNAKLEALGIEEYIKDFATRDTINKKIACSKSKYIATCYNNYYLRLVDLFNKTVENGKPVIEILIGVNLLLLATQNGYIGNESGEDDIAYYNSLLEYFDKDVYLTEDTKQVVIKMREASQEIFRLYWIKGKKPTNNKKKKKK